MSPLKILIVDDAPFIRDALRTILTRAGHHVVGEAENGSQAVEIALQTKPDLVIMDIVMPVKSGVQATKEILEALPSTRVIACSTADQDIMMMKVLEAGAVEFISKPFRSGDVVNVIAGVFEKSLW